MFRKATKTDEAIEFKKRLLCVQMELKAPKGQENKFGGYSYRSNEDILEALKPLLSKYNLYLIQRDKIVQIGDRYYVKAISKVQDVLSDKFLESAAFAREPVAKKGMDESQITGASSSYARKYSLNGLFGIDDTKDADATNKGPAPKIDVIKEIDQECDGNATEEDWKKSQATLQGKGYLAAMTHRLHFKMLVDDWKIEMTKEKFDGEGE